MFVSKTKIFRYVLFLLSSLTLLAAGIYCIGRGSVIDLFHFLIIPLLISYVIIFKPEIIRKNLVPYSIFLAIVTLLTVIYLLAFSKVIAEIRINWTELPIAVYFLLSVYAMLWLLDKLINFIVSAIPAMNLKGKIARITVKNGFRIAILVFAVIPYLVAVFTTHWIKFAGAPGSNTLLDMEFKQVCFNAKDGAKLDGWFIPSETSMSDSSVIIIPGRSLTKNLFLPYAKILCGNGYNVLLFDSRGNGDSSGHKYSFAVNETSDILGAVDYLQNNRPESSKYIFGLGINEGASALIGAAGIDERFTGVVIDSASGYEVSIPKWLANYLPDWMEKSLLKITNSVIGIDIGRPVWGKNGLYEKIAEISPCPVLITDSLKNDESSRTNAIELYSKAKDPKMLWLSPAEKEKQNTSAVQEYFKNILELFDFGRSKQESSRWRISRSD